MVRFDIVSGADPRRAYLHRVRALRGVAIVLVVLAAGCTDDGEKAGIAADGVPERGPAWEVPVSGIGPTRHASVVGDTVIVQGEKLVVALSRSNGSERWKQPIQPDTNVRVTPKSVVVYDERNIAAYDVRTGRPGFAHKNPDRGRAAVSNSAVFVHTCPTGVRSCTVVAYGLPGGTALWRYAHSRVLSVDPRVETPGDDSIRLSEPGRFREPLVARPADVVLIGREGPRTTDLSVLDAATGKVLDSRVSSTIWTRIIHGETAISWTDSKACDVRLTGHSVKTGKQLWTRSAGRWGEPGIGEPDCENVAWTPALNETTAAVTTPARRPSLIELDTGKVRWTGDAEDQVMDLSATTVLARADRGNGGLVGLDTADGHQRWKIELPDKDGKEHVDRWALVGGRLLFSVTDLDDALRQVVRVYNAETGEGQWAAKGSNWTLGVGPDWVVTAADGAEDDETPKTIRLYAG